jgi:hypothetical protein
MTSHLSVTGKRDKRCIPEILAPYFFNGKMVSMRTDNAVA